MTRCLILLAVLAPSVVAEELHLKAKTLFQTSVTHNLCLDHGAIVLEEGELFQDDGPAAGYSYRPNEDKISGDVRIRKELVIPNPRTHKATLLVSRGGDGLTIIINGKPVETKREGNAGLHWTAYDVPWNVLREGTNEIILGGTGSVFIARAEDFKTGSANARVHPKRSARSSDGGKTWQVDRLGPKGDISGEYSVRLFLHHKRPKGTLITPVMDMGNLASQAIAPPLEKLPSLYLSGLVSNGVSFRVRTGPDPQPDAKSFTPWQPTGVRGEVVKPAGRYFQVLIAFSEHETLPSQPGINMLSCKTNTPSDSAWSAKLKVASSHNPPIVRSAIPFASEPFDHPHLKELRETHRLDDIVNGAKDELETILRLAAWSSQRWQKGHLKDAYPPWDALAILKPHADGTPTGGFCQQYNLVFLQACESFGIPGRAVSIGPGEHSGIARRGGHEVVELWSNQFKKWIYIDGNLAFYAVDATTGAPLSLRELRDRQRQVDKGLPGPPTRIVNLPEATKPWESLKAWPPFQELRMIPRSNFLEQKSPLPLNQGMRGWSWTGHHVWTDAESPASLIYSNRVSQRSNWDWTLNHAHIGLEATPTPGELKVHLDTQTPGLAGFTARRDTGKPEPVAASFAWKLHPGRNRLEVRPRNIAGREGIPSFIEIEHP